MRGLFAAVIAAGCAGDAPGTKPTGTTGADDIDADFDGWPASEDCDDGDPQSFPGALDPWYDGIDQDCAGDDDFDQDADGHASAAHGGDDCADLDPGIAPSIAEVPYDGIDQDCDPATLDDDLDGDGSLGAEDCADEDPQRTPGALEVLDDGIDQDCDGVPDATPWGFDDLSFLDPTRPTLGETKDFVVLSVVAAQAESASWPELAEFVTPGLLLTLEPAGINGAPLAVDPVAWHGLVELDPIGSGDLHASGTTTLIATSYTSSVNEFGYLMQRSYEWLGTGIGWFPGNPTYRADVFATWSLVDLRARADGVTATCAADADTLGTLLVDPALAVAGVTLDGVDASRGCVWTADDQLTSIDGAGVATTWDVDPTGLPTVAAGQPFADGPWLLGHERGGVAVLVGVDHGIRAIGPDGATDWLGAYEIEDAEATIEADGTTWIAAVANRGGDDEVLVLSSSPTEGEVERWLDVQDGLRPLRPTGISILVTFDRVILAVSALDQGGTGRDAVGWALYGR